MGPIKKDQSLHVDIHEDNRHVDNHHVESHHNSCDSQATAEVSGGGSMDDMASRIQSIRNEPNPSAASPVSMLTPPVTPILSIRRRSGLYDAEALDSEACDNEDVLPFSMADDPYDPHLISSDGASFFWTDPGIFYFNRSLNLESDGMSDSNREPSIERKIDTGFPAANVNPHRVSFSETVQVQNNDPKGVSHIMPLGGDTKTRWLQASLVSALHDFSRSEVGRSLTDMNVALRTVLDDPYVELTDEIEKFLQNLCNKFFNDAVDIEYDNHAMSKWRLIIKAIKNNVAMIVTEYCDLNREAIPEKKRLTAVLVSQLTDLFCSLHPLEVGGDIKGKNNVHATGAEATDSLNSQEKLSLYFRFAKSLANDSDAEWFSGNDFFKSVLLQYFHEYTPELCQHLASYISNNMDSLALKPA